MLREYKRHTRNLKVLSRIFMLLLLFSRSVVSDSLGTHGLQPARLLCPREFLGKDTGMGCHYLLQGIFPTQGSNLRLLHWQVDSLPLSHPASHELDGRCLLAICLVIRENQIR